LAKKAQKQHKLLMARFLGQPQYPLRHPTRIKRLQFTGSIQQIYCTGLGLTGLHATVFMDLLQAVSPQQKSSKPDATWNTTLNI